MNGKNLEGNSCGLVELLSWHLFGLKEITKDRS
jgi:hypothetical protein